MPKGTPGKGGDAPSAPNFNAAATPNQTNAFGANSQWKTTYDQPVPDWVNNPTTAFGGLGHGQADADAWKQQHGQMSQTQSFDGPLAGAVTGLEGQIAGTAGTPLDNGAQARQHAEDAIYQREASRLDPMFAQRSHDLSTQLANQGIDPNSAAYGKALDNEGRTRNDAYSTALQQAIMDGGQEATRQQGMDLTSRMAPLQQLLGLSSLTGQSQNPLLPAAMAQYQGALQKYGMDQAGKNSAMNGITNLGGQLGSAAIMA